MMREQSAIDQAFERYKILSGLIEFEQVRARGNPQHQRYLDLGITDQGDSKPEAAAKTLKAFDELARLIEHVAILDMAGSLERSFRSRIGRTVGAIRSLIQDHPERDHSKPFAAKLVRDVEDFEGLHDIVSLLEDALSKQVKDAVTLVRKSRNAFAHGINLKIPPAVEPSQAKDHLNEIASRF